jgi:hypothetical protein
MQAQQQRNIDVERIHGPAPLRTAPPWLAENNERDNLASVRPLREPHFNDCDLLHGEWS